MESKGSSSRKLKLLTLFEVKRLSGTITEYVAIIHPGDSTPQKIYHIFLKNRMLYAIIAVLWVLFMLLAIRRIWMQLLWTTLAIGGIVALLHQTVLEESVTVIQNFGIQLKRRYFFGHEKIQFLERDRLKAVFIHEYIQHCAVHFALAFEVLDLSLSSADELTSSSSLSPLSPSPFSSEDHLTSSSHHPKSSTTMAKTRLLLAFDEVYPGIDALRKVYRACLSEEKDTT